MERPPRSLNKMSEPSEVKPPALDDVHKQELSELEYAEGADAVITFTRAEERRFLMKLGG